MITVHILWFETFNGVINLKIELKIASDTLHMLVVPWIHLEQIEYNNIALSQQEIQNM